MGEGEIMTTTVTNTTATLYLVQKLDSRLGGKTYASWTEGEVFAIQSNTSVHFLGYENFPSTTRIYDHTQITAKQNKYLVATEKWQKITFGDLPSYCMEVVLRMVSPDVIPWAETRWASYEDYLEWLTPTTLKGKLKKSLRNPSDFPDKELREVSEVVLLYNDGTRLDNVRKYLYCTPFGYYTYRVGYYYTEGYNYSVDAISKEEATRLLNQKKEQELAEERARKEFGRNCANLARKYKLPWEIIKLFRGKEEDISKAAWVAKSSLPPFLLNTYPSIIEVFREAKV